MSKYFNYLYFRYDFQQRKKITLSKVRFTWVLSSRYFLNCSTSSFSTSPSSSPNFKPPLTLNFNTLLHSNSPSPYSYSLFYHLNLNQFVLYMLLILFHHLIFMTSCFFSSSSSTASTSITSSSTSSTSSSSSSTSSSSSSLSLTSSFSWSY